LIVIPARPESFFILKRIPDTPASSAGVSGMTPLWVIEMTTSLCSSDDSLLFTHGKMLARDVWIFKAVI
jgi:hypothetical protein